MPAPVVAATTTRGQRFRVMALCCFVDRWRDRRVLRPGHLLPPAATLWCSLPAPDDGDARKYDAQAAAAREAAHPSGWRYRIDRTILGAGTRPDPGIPRPEESAQALSLNMGARGVARRGTAGSTHFLEHLLLEGRRRSPSTSRGCLRQRGQGESNLERELLVSTPRMRARVRGLPGLDMAVGQRLTWSRLAPRREGLLDGRRHPRRAGDGEDYHGHGPPSAFQLAVR